MLRGETMRVERTLVGLFIATAVTLAGCGGRLAYNLPPADQLMHPGPGVDGPGPGVIPPAGGMGGVGMGAYGMGTPGMGGGMGEYCGPDAGGMADGGVQQASFCSGGSCGCNTFGAIGSDCFTTGGGIGGMGGMAGAGSTSQIAFLGDEGVQISWDVSSYGLFDSSPLVVPGRQDFYQGAIYRLKLTNIPGRPGVELYPTLEVAPVTPRTDAYLAHAPIPVQFTEEDFDQVLSGNFVTKVIYLPDPEFQELALAGVETLVSTRLPPGVDPIAEADRRGSILAIVRMGNKDLETSGGMAQTGPDGVIPAGYQASSDGGYSPEEFDAAGYPIDEYAQGSPQGMYGDGSGAVPAQYCYDGSGGMGSGMPMGMPTAGFAPPAVPPHMIAGGPQWGMPITGTPIGLPGPPHIPHGVPAGLQKHTMKNRTRVLLPPPTSHVHLSVKQRPGLNYPRPVNRVTVDETQREPLRLFPFMDLFHRQH